MMKVKLLPFILTATLVWGMSTPSHALAKNPIETLHQLQLVQDRLANGDNSALAIQSRLLSELGVQLEQADLDFFDNKQNFYAVVLYLFNGGSAPHVAHILKDRESDPIDGALIKGALAYSQGHEAEFHAALGGENLNDESWPQALRASIYLAITPRLMKKNPTLADARLDYVRLVAPGSLFEEAALRRQIKIVANLHNNHKLARLVRHYAARFPNSPYMRDFWAEVLEAVASAKSAFDKDEIESLLAPMPDKLRYVAYLHLARLSLIDADLEQVSLNAIKAQEIAEQQGLDDRIARFYQAAAQIDKMQDEDAKAWLMELDVQDLPARDHGLLAAVQNVAQAISWQPEMGTDLEDEAALQTDLPDENLPPSKRSSGQNDNLQIDEFLQPIKNRIKEIDALLESKK